MPFSCSICEQESTRICASCTKDACDNHLCDHCGCCSDCCECEVPLDGPPPILHAGPPPDPDWSPAPLPPVEEYAGAPEEPGENPLEPTGV